MYKYKIRLRDETHFIAPIGFVFVIYSRYIILFLFSVVFYLCIFLYYLYENGLFLSRGSIHADLIQIMSF